ncbi:MAG: twin-arginine translocation signal domain-containing protein [Armatimonadota bacterium]|nr:twin-arginine translocation signal domain-containing protein [Armatimonadota bacterium]MDR7570238.1 twin-arginine translocation signal domain-containing protein [Armatimonadota bacterium]MDR7615566.1 twin-arginine translocation signal domain-containing protein [Armatimonadota bacterium]
MRRGVSENMPDERQELRWVRVAEGRWRLVTRREFLKLVGAGLGAAAFGPFVFTEKTAAQPVTLRILQWRHFVPPYDEWFNKVFAPRWGEKNGVRVVVENVGLAEIPAIAAGEAARVAAGADPGHDMIQYLTPPATLERQVDTEAHREVIEELRRKVGPYIPLAEKSTYNPVTRRYFGVSDNFVPDPMHYRGWMWREASAKALGRSTTGPVTWDDVRKVGRELRRMGHPVGLGLSQEIDTGMWLRSLLYSWGTGEQDEGGNVILDVPPYRQRTIDALKFVRDLYNETMFAGVFAWTAASNNEEFLAGRISIAMNAISITRTAQALAAQALKRGEDPRTSKAVLLARDTLITERAPQGPAGARGLEHVMGVYFIWRNRPRPVREAAKKLLIDLILSYDPEVAAREGWPPGKFQASQAYDYPTFENAIPKAKRLAYLRNDPVSRAAGDRPDKLVTIETAYEWAHNVGWPGPSSAAIDEVFNTWILNVMFARVAQGIDTPEQALDAAARQIRRVFQKWREQGLVGGRR